MKQSDQNSKQRLSEKRMHSQEETGRQKRLVSVIQGVHEELRYKVQKDPESYLSIWKQHCIDPVRSSYATAMRSLATEVWASKTNKGNRIEIAKDVIENYFFGAGFLTAIRRMLRKYSASSKHSELEFMKDPPSKHELRVLDVGSCYNPFAEYGFDVTPVDLCPAIAGVFQCDFVNAHFGDDLEISNGSVKSLPHGYFDAVVFCLLLEYLPDRRLRLSAVHNSYRALRNNGILVVITPDSKHQQKNMDMIQSWQRAFSALGFDRISYAKHEHLHCIALRKLCGISREIMHLENRCGHSFDQLCSSCIQKISPMLFIYQDKHDYISKFEAQSIPERSTEEEHQDAKLFGELPHT